MNCAVSCVSSQEETGWPVDFLHFGSDAYWLGHYNRSGSGPGQTAFVPTTPQQQFGPGALEGHGYYSRMAGRFVWVRLALKAAIHLRQILQCFGQLVREWCDLE